MYCMTVTYPREDATRFDYSYYREKHLPLCAEAFGPHGYQGIVLRGPQGARPGAEDATFASVDILFDSLQSLKNALKAGGAAVNEDIPNYTDSLAVITFSEVDVSLRS